MVFFHTQIRCFVTSVYCFIFEMHFIPIWYEKMDEVWNWLALSPTRGLLLSPKGVRRVEMATDARSRGVQGHVVRSSIVVSPGGKVWKMCPRYETSPQRYENKNLKVWNFFYKVWNFCIGVWKKFLRYENKNLKVRVWNWFLRVWKIFWQGMKLLYKGMKKVFKVWNFCIRVWKKFSFFGGYETIFEGMKKYLLGMKKNRFLQKNSFIP